MAVEEKFSCYLALGDSMSIDYYPSEDKRFPLALGKDVGAASLFFRNANELWPEFTGQDLDTRFPKIYFSNHTFDGATTGDLLTQTRLSELEPFRNARVIATLTIGGNDLLEALRLSQLNPIEFERQLAEVQKRYTRLLDELQKRLTNALFLVSTIYDPTDGTGRIPGHPLYQARLPIEFLQQFNQFIRSAVSEMKTALICDVHAHFLGHGVTTGEEMWYWIQSPIEPGARGASEIRRVWLDSINGWSVAQ